MDKKSGMGLLLMSKPKPAEDEDDSSTAEVAAQAVLDAIESGSASELASALKSAIAACSESDY